MAARVSSEAAEPRVYIRTDAELVEIHVHGKLDRDAYRNLVPLLERFIRAHGKIRVLFVMRGFHGWTAGALWEDLRFDLRHFADIERLAIVGEKRWHRSLAAFCRPFTTARIRYFDASREEEARGWLRGILPASSWS